MVYDAPEKSGGWEWGGAKPLGRAEPAGVGVCAHSYPKNLRQRRKIAHTSRLRHIRAFALIVLPVAIFESTFEIV